MRGLLVAAAAAAAVVAGGAFGFLGAVRAQDAPEGRERYGGTPEEVAPYRGVEPARRFFVDPAVFRGAGREDLPPADLDHVAIGIVAPLTGYDVEPGRRMLNGIEFALAEANAAGGFGEHKLPFKAVVRDEGARWGAAGDALVDLVDTDGAWAVLGAYEDANSHVMTRVVLKVQVPLVNTAGVDPTLTEHMVPWVVRVRPDDRQTSMRLLKKVFTEDGHKRVVMFRANDRYGRTGVLEFMDAARRLGRPVPLEERFEPGDTEWTSRIQRILAAKPDAIVMWGRPGPTGAALRALRDAGITLPVYGPDRLVDKRFLEAAGRAAEGFVFTYPMDPRTGGTGAGGEGTGGTATSGTNWAAFRDGYHERYGEDPDATAAYAYDGARMIIDSIRKAGLNRALISDALAAHTTWEGVTGTIRFDTTMNNVSKVILGHVEKGRFVFGE